MSPYFAFGLIYFISWWLVLFMVLPFGVQMADIPDKNSYAGAPERPRLGRKMAITSVLALIPSGLLYWGLASGYLRGLL